MGKNLISQKRGRGTSVYKARSFRYAGKAGHRQYAEEEKNGMIKGEVQDIIHSAGHYAPLARIKYADKKEALAIAPFGMRVGEEVFAGKTAEIKDGNTIPLSQIPEGTLIFNIESAPGDGGKFVRSSGCFARLLSRTPTTVKVMLPSKREHTFRADCRATVGVIAGGGRVDKPMLKAGLASMKAKARGKHYPKVSGLAMNAVSHPFGGTSSHHKGIPLIARRFAPAGAKAGSLRPKRTGRRKSKS